MEAYFVTFLSPGTFVAEQTTKEIDGWDTNKAIEMSKDITERYGAKPYGFYFTTRERGEDELDSKQVDKSGMYYLGGEIKTIEDLEKENDPSNETLIQNMKSNGWDKVIDNRNSWRWTQPLMPEDIVL